MTAEADDPSAHADVETPSAPTTRAVVAALAGIGAAWVAAGSIGLVADPLRHGLASVALAAGVIACWPARQTWPRRLILLAGLAAAAGMMVPAMPVYNVLAVCLVLAILSWANRGLDQRVLLLAALGAAVLGVYLLAWTTVPTVWSIADALGRTLGRAAAAVSGRPLWIGATFAGLDFLVLMAAVYVGWLAWTAPPRLGRALVAGAAILGGHLAYLVVLSYATDLYEALPPAPPPPEFRDYIPPPWHWTDAARSLLPWNLPLLAAAIQLAVAAMMLRWAAWLPVASGEGRVVSGEWRVASGARRDDAPCKQKQDPQRKDPRRKGKQPGRGARKQDEKRAQITQQDATNEAAPADWRDKAQTWAPVALAVLVPLVTTLAPGPSRVGRNGIPSPSAEHGLLAGKKIVACNQGYLDWERPVHGRYGQASAGMYGMLPEFVASLGGRLEPSDELSAQHLQEADVLLLIHPVGPWPEDRLARVREFVLRGGSLLVLAGTPVREGELASSYDDVLGYVLTGNAERDSVPLNEGEAAPAENARPAAAAIEVRFDTAASVTWHWQDAYAAMAHPAVMGVEDGRNRFGMVSGPSLRVRWPARPILVGRWGWSDPGIDLALTRVYRYHAGEKLGDLVLAAEQRLGRGTVVVVSDAFGFTNEGNVNSYVFTGRMLAYLAGGAGSPQAAWRQLLGLLACVALVGLVALPLEAVRLARVAVILALVLAGSRTISSLSMRVLPDGRQHAPSNNVAYIDASHMEAYSDAGWGFDGVAGLALTLMRNGFQAFLLPELTSERLGRAGMLVSIAPSRPFSRAEAAAVRRFVEDGGIFICTVGADRVWPVQPLLEEFDLRVPPVPIPPERDVREPAPMGHFRTLYRPPGADYDARLLVYHGWPVECSRTDELVRGFGNLPIIALGDVNGGKVVLVGDTAFAMNKNLEYIGGEPFGGRYDNAHFWRWLIGTLTGQGPWLPPRAERRGEQPASQEGAPPVPEVVQPAPAGAQPKPEGTEPGPEDREATPEGPPSALERTPPIPKRARPVPDGAPPGPENAIQGPGGQEPSEDDGMLMPSEAADAAHGADSPNGDRGPLLVDPFGDISIDEVAP
jgi:hypothetical protein